MKNITLALMIAFSAPAFSNFTCVSADGMRLEINEVLGEHRGVLTRDTDSNFLMEFKCGTYSKSNFRCEEIILDRRQGDGSPDSIVVRESLDGSFSTAVYTKIYRLAECHWMGCPTRKIKIEETLFCR